MAYWATLRKTKVVTGGCVKLSRGAMFSLQRRTERSAPKYRPLSGKRKRGSRKSGESSGVHGSD